MPRSRKPSDDANRVPSTFVPKFWEKHSDQRSLVTRTILARRAELTEAVQADSPQVDIIIQRICYIELVLNTLEIESLETGVRDFGVYSSMTNTLMGLLKSIGLERKAKRVGTLQDHLKERAAS